MLSASVVVSTYNGSEFVGEQLDSLLGQTLVPDEIVVADDCSSDMTCEIVRTYAQQHAEEVNWRLVSGERNQGFARNFIDAALASSGDIVFFCDQDDVWDAAKVERMMTLFEQRSDALAAHCFARTIDRAGRVVQTAFDRYASPGEGAGWSKEGILDVLKYRRSPGLCLALRRELLPEVNRWNSLYGCPHDLPVGFIASARNGYYAVNEVLVSHRMIGNNTSNPHKSVKSRIRDRDYQIASTKNALKYFDIVLLEYGDFLPPNELALVQEGHDVLQESAAALLDFRGGLRCLRLLARRCEAVSVQQRALNLLCCVFGRRISREGSFIGYLDVRKEDSARGDVHDGA